MELLNTMKYICCTITHPKYGTVGLKDVNIRSGRVSGKEITTAEKAPTTMSFSVNCIQDIWIKERS